jgi:hypothetical protein
MLLALCFAAGCGAMGPGQQNSDVNNGNACDPSGAAAAGHVCDPTDTQKTTICHVPPGNPGNAHTLCVGNSAVPAHLAHGDHLGACAPCALDGGTTPPPGNPPPGNPPPSNPPPTSPPPDTTPPPSSPDLGSGPDGSAPPIT